MDNTGIVLAGMFTSTALLLIFMIVYTLKNSTSFLGKFVLFFAWCGAGAMFAMVIWTMIYMMGFGC